MADAERPASAINGDSAIRVSRYVSLEAIDEDHVVLVQTAEQHRVRVPRRFYEFLRSCDGDRPLSSILGAEPPERLVALLTTLLAKRFVLVQGEDVWDRPRRLTSAVPFKMFGAPEFAEGSRSDLVALGVPYDLTDPAPSGCRLSPDRIRQRSFDFRYEIDFATGEPRGWFDAEREVRILESIRIADAGNVVVQYGERQGELFSRVEEMARRIVGAGGTPMVLGGDHSISVPMVASFAGEPGLIVFALSAHTQFDPDVPDGIVNAASACRKMWEMPHVAGMVLVGHRGYTRNAKVGMLPKNVDVVTVARLRADGRLAALADLPADQAVYLTIDANVLDPSVMPAARVLTPEGLSLAELKELIAQIGRRSRIVGFDLVGFDGSYAHGPLGEIVACHVMLVTAAAATRTFDGPDD